MTAARPLRPPLLEAGLVLVVVGVPLVFAPFSHAPFADAKLVTLLAGVLLVAASRVQVDRRIGFFAGAWFLIAACAAVRGVDPWWSLMGAESQDAGLLLWGASGLLLVAGTGIPGALADRVPHWLVGTATAVAAVAVLQRLGVPGAAWGLGTAGSTLGHPVFLGGFLAAGVAAATSLRVRPRIVAALVVIGSGLAVSANRAGWIGAALGLALALRRSRASRRTAVAVIAPVLAALMAWTVADLVLQPSTPLSAARRFAEVREGSARMRLQAWPACLRAWLGDPMLGSGPGTTWGRYLSSATLEELRVAGRGWGDAHNLLVESLLTTGAAGTLGLSLIGGMTAFRARRAPPELGWAPGAAVAVGVTHLLQPLSVSLTPLLFLLGGLAAGGSPRRGAGLARPVPALVAIGLALAVLRLGASSAEQYGRTYGSDPALRGSLRLEPFRISAAQALALSRALDARSADPAAASEARRLAHDTVRRHAWNPGVRLAAAEVEALLGDPGAAERWIRVHLRQFPDDPVALAGAARLALQRGDKPAAIALARRALDIRPSRDLGKLLRDAGA